MKMTRRILSWVLAIALVVTCGITGLVLPVVAEDAPADLFNGQGTFEDGTTPSSTALSDMVGQSDAVIVDNPDGDGKVLQIGKFVDEDGDGVNDGAYTHTSYHKWKKLYNAETGAYNKAMTAGKSYTLKMDVYGDGIGLYFQGDYHVTSENADDKVGVGNGWFQLGNGAEEWKTYTFVFYADDDIAESYQADWWSWGMSFSKTASSSCQPGNGFTYIDNVQLYETQATEIAINKSDFAMEPGEVAEALTVTANPARSAHADIVWSSNAEGVAKVDAKTGVITAVANGTATITATAGTLTDTITVKVQKDKTQTWADLSEAYYATGDNKNQKVTLNTDTATGLEYFSVNGSASVRVPNWCGTVEKGQIVGLTFLVRVTDAANNAGDVHAGVQMQGLVNGYSQPEFYARSTAMGGGWERVTFYAREEYVNSYPYFVFIYIAKNTTAATPSYDVADVSVFLPEADDVNRFGAGADFEEGYAPVALGDYQQADLLTKTEVVDDPTGADNKVLYISSAAANGGAGSYWYVAQYSRNDANGKNQTYYFESTKMYKVSFRVYSASEVAIDSFGGQAFKGTTGKAAKSGQWRTVTTYMYTSGSLNSAYALHVRFYGEAYIDDLEMYECVDATGFEVKGDKEMTIGESQTLEIVSVPKHSFPGTLTTALADGTTGLTLSGTTVTAAAVAGVEVKGGTVTVTSDLTDAETGNPITASIDIKVNYPEEHFVNGTMDTGALDGIYFGTSTSGLNIGVAGIGVDGTTGMEFTVARDCYFKGQTYVLRPNSLYAYSVAARSNGTGAKLELLFSAGNNSDGNKVNNTAGLGTKDLSTEWTTYTAYFMTGPTTTYFEPDWSLGLYCRALGTVEGSATAPVYVDNISMKLIETENFVMLNQTHSSSAISMSADGGETWSTTVLRDVAPGTVIKVKTWHNYNLTQLPGAFKFITNTGVSTPILSPNVTAGSTAETFGKYAGDICEFVMPEVNNGLVYAPIVNTSSLGGDFAMDTVATSLRKTATEGKYDGIRFLTRLALDKTFDPDAETLTVTYGDVEYTVVEFGSLLKRSSNELELTVENYDAQDGSAAQRMWKSAAYEAGNPMKLLDYTSTKSANCTNYIDFASVMTMGEGMDSEAFAAREYTARGYMILRPAEGEDVVVYSTNTQTDSVNSAAARLP